MKGLIRRIIIVVLFLGVFIYLINQAPDYDIEYKYNDGDLRVIFNDREITRDKSKLPEVATVINGEIMLSHNTIDILFDKDLYFEEKYNTFITTSDDERADITIGSNTMVYNGEEKGIKTPAIMTNYDYKQDNRYNSDEEKVVYYLPINELKDLYKIDVVFDDKLIITTSNIDLQSFNSNADEIVEIKYLEDNNSKTIEQVNPGDIIYVFNFDESKPFNKVRSQDGELGYLSTELIKTHNLSVVSTSKTEEIQSKEKIYIAWDSINPLASSIGKKAERNNIKNINVVCPTLLYFSDSTGEIHYMKNTVKEYIDWADYNDFDVWLTLKNEDISITKQFNKDDLSEFLNDMHNRSKAIDQLINICKTYEVQGINIDIENIYQKDAKAFTQFVRELTIEAHHNDLVVSVCVNVPDGSPEWSLCYEHKLLAECCDYICLMAYQMSNTTVSSFAPYNWVYENVYKLVERDKVISDKILLGVDFGSALWTVNGDKKSRSILFMSGAKKYLSGSEWDESAKQYYYENISNGEYIWIEEETSIKEKLSLIGEFNLGGAAFWALDHETSDFWKSLNNIKY